MKDITPTTFGYMIGFLLPGLLGLYGLGYWYSDVREMVIRPGQEPSAAIGPSVLVLLAASGTGLMISAIRWLVFELPLGRRKKMPSLADLTAEKLTPFKTIIDEHYRYHQFYGGIALSTTVAFSGWVHTSWKALSRATAIGVVCVFVAILAVAIVAAVDSYCKCVDRCESLLTGKSVAKAVGKGTN